MVLFQFVKPPNPSTMSSRLSQVLSTVRSTASSLTSRAEADAAWLENQASQRIFAGASVSMDGADTVSATVREFRQLQRDFSLDDFTETVRAELRSLDPNCMKDFRGLAAEQRRKVHLVAAELGMLSQSYGCLGREPSLAASA